MLNSIPQEIQENIIDKFAENANRKDVLQLRLVSQSWRPRVDYNAFLAVNMKLHEGAEFIHNLH
jgi:hypothetical protein